MSMVDSGQRPRDALPSIGHLDLDKIKMARSDNQRYPMMGGLSINTAPPGSPATIYSGPPPPYSYTSSIAGSTHNPSGYISPPESTRRSTRDEKESPPIRKSLPSIQEALGDKTMPYPTAHAPVAPSAVSHPSLSAPPSAVSQSFPDAPKGPSNPFSQPLAPASAMKDSMYDQQPPRSSHAVSEPQPRPGPFPAVSTADPRASFPQSFAPPRSPRHPPIPSFNSVPQSYPDTSNNHDPAPLRSPSSFTIPRTSFNFQSQYSNPTPSSFPHPRETSPHGKLDDQRFPVPRSEPTQPYGEAVKRHLEGWDADMALNEIAEASSRTLEFSRGWAQRSHQHQRTGYFPEALPGLHEIDDMIRQSTRVVEGLTRIRDVVIAQQTAISEQHARAMRGHHYDDDYSSIHDDYSKGGAGFHSGDAKKRRGKAAPPGRCHSCNRAETPEWRRGPDGARTLCNACGLHYAKLTRKMGVNKAAALSGSNLRPKSIDPRSPHL